MAQEDHRKAMRKVAATALAGTSIEWYDFFLYGTAAALVFPVLFFPADMPPMVALIASFSTFAVGFLARPIGGIVFGHMGDRVGRKKALVAALLIMGVATTLIGALPSYAVIGPAAPLLLVLFRFAQGLAIGGQWGGAVLLVTENAPVNERGFWGSFAQVGAPCGVILANLAFLIVSNQLSTEAFMAWGWRVPFLLSVVLIGLSLYVQLHLEDTPAFRELEAAKQAHDAERRAEAAAEGNADVATLQARKASEADTSPVLLALRKHPREILLGAGAFLSVQVTFYILITFVIAYGTRPEGLALPRETMLLAVLAGALVMVPAVIGSAWLSDRYGRRGIYMLGAVLLGAWGFALFPLIDTGEFALICLAIGVGQLFVSMMYGPQAALLSELFSTEVRYSGASLGYQLGAIAGGGLAPIIATALLAQQGGTIGISVYIAGASAMTVASMLALRETYRDSLHG
jgi:MFS family permease